MQQVVVTGATGFVGNALVHRLLAEGFHVKGVLRQSSDLSKLSGLENSTYAYADITDRPSLHGVFDSADMVIHAAGMLGEAGIPESDYMRLHVDGTRNVLDEIQLSKSNPRFVYISSPGVLGPIVDGVAADEAQQLAPSNAYERSKAAAERLVTTYFDKIDTVIVRPEFIYGPTDLHVLGLFQAIKKRQFFYIGGGRHTCHPTYIDDAVSGTLLAMQKGQRSEIYHITGPKAVTFREFGRTIAETLNVKPPFLNVPRPIAMVGATILEQLMKKPPLSTTGVAFFSESRRFSWQKAHDQLGYSPQFSLADGIRATVAWYRENGHL